MKRWVAAGGTSLVLAGALAGSSRSARADASDAQLDLRWSAPAECPSRAEELAEISRILGDANGARRQVAAIAIVARDASGWHATLSTRTSQGAGDRVFDGASCDAIAHAVALIVALAVDEQTEAPAAAASESSASASPIANAMAAPSTSASPPVAPPTAAPSAPGERALQPPPRDRALVVGQPPSPLSFATVTFVPRLAVSLGVGADSATLPSPAAGSELSGGLLLVSPRWVARTEGYVSYFPVRTATASDANEGGRFSLISTGIRISGAAALGRFTVGPCVGAEIDFMPVTAFGAAGTSTPGGEGTWGALTGGGLASFAISPAISLRLRAEADIPLVRPTFVVDEPELATTTFVHRAAPVSGRVAMGAELDFF